MGSPPIRHEKPLRFLFFFPTNGMRKSFLLASAAAAFTVAMPALAASHFTLDGSATNHDGEIAIESTGFDGGSITFGSVEGITFGSLSGLSADVDFTDDDCGGGSPRFSFGIDTNGDSVRDGYLHVYVGPPPSFTGCVSGPTGNLLAGTDARFDLTQFGGPFYGTYADAVALVGSGTILDAMFAVDGGWSQADGEQTVHVDNVVIGEHSFDFTPPPASEEQCKKGAWRMHENPSFKNQGQCVSHFNKQKNR